MRKMTHRERFLYERWKEKRAAKQRAKALARKARQIDPQAKASVGFWPGMYEGAPQPRKSELPIHYAERAIKSVGWLKGVTKNTHEFRSSKKATPIASKIPTSSMRDLSGGEAVNIPHPESDRSQEASITCLREIQ